MNVAFRITLDVWLFSSTVNVVISLWNAGPFHFVRSDDLYRQYRSIRDTERFSIYWVCRLK